MICEDQDNQLTFHSELLPLKQQIEMLGRYVTPNGLASPIFSFKVHQLDVVETANAKGVAIDEEGHVIISTYEMVHIHGDGGNFIHRFVKGENNREFKNRVNLQNPVAVDGMGHIILYGHSTGDIYSCCIDGTVQLRFSTKKLLRSPGGLAVDKNDDSIIVTDKGTHSIIKFDSTGKFIYRVGGKGFEDGKLRHPHGVVVDSEGNIIVADTGNQRVCVFSRFVISSSLSPLFLFRVFFSFLEIFLTLFKI